MITSLRGILIDVDPDRFHKSVLPFVVTTDPIGLYETIVRPMLARHPVLGKAEVRVSGRGLHILLWLDPPVEFLSHAERQRWAAVVKVIQCLLPSDPDCPGITALTRPIGSINAKNKVTVKQLQKGKPVTAEEITALFDEARSRPFRTVARILLGTDRLSPCPVCKGDGTRMDALDHAGKCYGGCGKVKLRQLYDLYLKPRGNQV
jgi:hypothetical protein